MGNPRSSVIDVLKLWLGAVMLLMYFTGRSDLGVPFFQGFGFLAGLMVVAFGTYAWILKKVGSDREHRFAVNFSILVRLGMICCLPNLSDDFYRYIWDGRLMWEGINPYDWLPSEWMSSLDAASKTQWAELYGHLNSKEYYSVYPPVLQGVFALATRISGGDVFGSVLVMKGVIVLAEIGSIWILQRLVKLWKLPRKSVLIYALNPLVILELSGNLHFEALMVFFMLAAIWMLTQVRRWILAAPLLALAIGSKLLPVLIFPFLVKRMGWLRAILLGISTLLFTGSLFMLLIDGQNLPHFLESIRLYFQKFEFNGGLYYLLRTPLGPYGFWINRILPWVMAALILWSAFREKDNTWKGLPAALLLALTLYQLHSPVIHPWYLTPLVALAALTRYRFAIVWSFLVGFTYLNYFIQPYHEQMWIVTLEYLTLLGFMAYEWTFRRKQINLEQWLLQRPWFRKMVERSIPARLKIKQARISRHLLKGENILDIGTGNGGLCHALRGEGFDITPLDVQNLSFFADVQPTIYDGKTIPYPDKTFDTSLLITMLHHTPSPEAVLDEALRVTRTRLVIMEDVYRNIFQKHLTFFTDSLVNLEFEGHPHTNKTDAAWQELFAARGLKLVYREEFRTLVFFRQVVYVVEFEGRTN
jgi:alpha-1,6-mannosyltransferase